MRPGNLQSIREGRSEPPTIPIDFFWIDLTARVNRVTRAGYKFHELQQMPADELERILAYLHLRQG